MIRFFFQVLRRGWIRWVAMRHLRNKNSAFLNFITVLSIMGVALGVAAMIIVLSVMDGFESQLKLRLMGTDLHLLISPTPQVPGFEGGDVPRAALESNELFAQWKKDPRVVSIDPIISSEVILKTGAKVTGIVVKGVTDERLNRLKKQVKEVADPSILQAEAVQLPSIYVGKELAYSMGVIPGDLVTLVSPTETEGPMSTVPRSKRFVIQGIFESGLQDHELHTVYGTDRSLWAFLKRKDIATNWEVRLKNFDDAESVRKDWEGKVPYFKVQDWKELNSHLFASLRLERIAMFIIMVFVIIVASFNIVTTLTLMVLEKKKEISILKAMGAQHSEIGAIFVSEGLFIGSIGTGLGILVSLGLSAILRRYEFIQLPDFYYDRTLPITFNWFYYLVVPLSAFLVVLFACYYPSARASRLHPLQGIRS